MTKPKKPKKATDAKALFEAYERASNEAEEARMRFQGATANVSAAIAAIHEALGSGPFLYRGVSQTIVRRTGPRGEGYTYYFKAINKHEPIEID